jgi:thioredoxin 1
MDKNKRIIEASNSFTASILVLFILLLVPFHSHAARNGRKEEDEGNDYQNALIQITGIEDFLQKMQDSEKPALVEFYSDWCPPCRKMAPILNTFAHDNMDTLSVYRVNFDYERALVRKFDVIGIPTLIVFKNGEEIERAMGFKDYRGLESFLAPHLE